MQDIRRVMRRITGAQFDRLVARANADGAVLDGEQLIRASKCGSLFKAPPPWSTIS